MGPNVSSFPPSAADHPLPDGPQAALLGCLIGLSRATEGNEHKVTPDMDLLVLEALAASLAETDSIRTEDLITRVKEAKRQLIPLCYDCASPCGRNNDYDFSGFPSQPEEKLLPKVRLLQALQASALRTWRSVKNYESTPSPAYMDLVYMILYAIGRDDWGPAELQPILERSSTL
ncbi:MAG: hypothetical protein IJC68_02750 [Firmicutes bacterium]|nr:hypothetical protein [Bacillota bacterium]